MSSSGSSLTTRLFFLIEFLDEFIYGAREAAWPLIRIDLGLTYSQIGVLLGLPGLISALLEPVLGVLGDVWRRRALILGGGVVLAASLVLTGVSRGYWPLLVSLALFSPASGAFVSLSQASLMDAEPLRREHNMVLWSLAGSLGMVLGPIALSAALAISFGWRIVYGIGAVAAGALVAAVARCPWRDVVDDEPAGSSLGLLLRRGLVGAWHALRRGEVLRWLALLQASDLMLDVFLGFVALYLVDAAAATSGAAALAVAILTGASTVGTLFVAWLLRRVSGPVYLRVSAALVCGLLAGLLLIRPLVAKVVAVALMGLATAGWYPVLKARLYNVLPGRSGTAMAVSNVAGLVGGLIPMGLGVVADRAGVAVAMALLIAGPIALLLGLPREPSVEPTA